MKQRNNVSQSQSMEKYDIQYFKEKWIKNPLNEKILPPIHTDTTSIRISP